MRADNQWKVGATRKEFGLLEGSDCPPTPPGFSALAALPNPIRMSGDDSLGNLSEMEKIGGVMAVESQRGEKEAGSVVVFSQNEDQLQFLR
ncbi:hypothetical protein RUM44_012582 [Polyplax serrata]|uniref:Uncharacterized protein n=1 Tax=Polyplax serrata TaxID=468196 RepID=A0ABR1BFS6_POLSC